MNMNKSTSMILQTFFSLFLLLSSERLSNYKRFTWCCNIFTLFLILLNSHHKLWKPFLFFITHFEIRQNCLDQFTIFKKTQKEKFNNTLRFYKKAYSWFRKKKILKTTHWLAVFSTLSWNEHVLEANYVTMHISVLSMKFSQRLLTQKDSPRTSTALMVGFPFHTKYIPTQHITI